MSSTATRQVGQDRNGHPVRVGSVIYLDASGDTGIVTDIRGDALIYREISSSTGIIEGGYNCDVCSNCQVQADSIAATEIQSAPDDVGLSQFARRILSIRIRLDAIHEELRDLREQVKGDEDAEKMFKWIFDDLFEGDAEPGLENLMTWYLRHEPTPQEPSPQEA
ncbi:hypothetical protein [Fontivita pretiosa]|uniref:hypothetical protein n=1 Tax=Fontivita pretiosa TaxID=2989684 RepID=UPI003D1716BD